MCPPESRHSWGNFKVQLASVMGLRSFGFISSWMSSCIAPREYAATSNKWGTWVGQLGFSSPPAGLTAVPQMLGGFTSTDGIVPQRTFLTTDSIAFRAIYSDNASACIEVAPTFVQLFVFNVEGRFILQTNAGSTPLGAGSKSRTLSIDLPPGTLAPDSYIFTFLVRDCTNTKSVMLPEFLTFRVIGP